MLLRKPLFTLFCTCLSTLLSTCQTFEKKKKKAFFVLLEGRLSIGFYGFSAFLQGTLFSLSHFFPGSADAPLLFALGLISLGILSLDLLKFAKFHGSRGLGFSKCLPRLFASVKCSDLCSTSQLRPYFAVCNLLLLQGTCLSEVKHKGKTQIFSTLAVLRPN